MRQLAVRDDRRADLAQIHMLQKQLGLTSEDASALKLTLTGVASSGEMSGPQRSKLLAHLRTLALRSGVAQGTVKKPHTPTHKAHKSTQRPAWKPKHRLAFSLWQQLADARLVDERSASALQRYVKRQTGVDQLTWLNAAQLDLLIESLKKWLSRGAA